MQILASWSGRLIIHAAVLELLGTIMVCYGIAVSLGHVPAWLPMISDCAVSPPEMYIFRLGIVVGASLIAVQCVTVYYADRTMPLGRLRMSLGVVAAAGLGVVGVVNEKENDSIHSVCAVTFFVLYDIYMLLSLLPSIDSRSSCKLRISIVSFLVKLSCAVLGSIAGILYTLYKCGVIEGSKGLAAVEWTNTFLAMIFVWSYLLDKYLDDVNLSEVRDDNGRNDSHRQVKYSPVPLSSPVLLVKKHPLPP